ncbi:alpha/beta fold hydrolase [Streptomyces bottropensis]|uniref:alpha/beta fold hydrolase n=1 Tax=Streptomyces bottropensis TaxID=42235 RepID=UPI00367E1EF8
MAGEVARWFSTVGLTRPPVVGNSLGGAVALELARTGAVSNAVALSPIGLWTSPEAAYVLGSLRLARMMAESLGERTARVTGHPLGRTLAFWQLVARPRQMTAQAADGALRNLARSPGFEATRRTAHHYRLRGFTPGVPVTVAWGTRDLLTPLHQARRTTRLLPRARHLRLHGCGYSPMSDDPARVATSCCPRPAAEADRDGLGLRLGETGSAYRSSRPQTRWPRFAYRRWGLRDAARAVSFRR